MVAACAACAPSPTLPRCAGEGVGCRAAEFPLPLKRGRVGEGASAA
ncbi:hypothetical protein [Azospirillum largimobile]